MFIMNGYINRLEFHYCTVVFHFNVEHFNQIVKDPTPLDTATAMYNNSASTRQAIFIKLHCLLFIPLTHHPHYTRICRVFLSLMKEMSLIPAPATYIFAWHTRQETAMNVDRITIK